MSHEKFDFNCPGCAPVIIDVKTKRALPDDHPMMVKALRVYREASHLERLAWHAVTCLNSRRPLDLALCKAMMDRISAD